MAVSAGCGVLLNTGDLKKNMHADVLRNVASIMFLIPVKNEFWCNVKRHYCCFGVSIRPGAGETRKLKCQLGWNIKAEM